jgi:hypothetical protein
VAERFRCWYSLGKKNGSGVLTVHARIFTETKNAIAHRVEREPADDVILTHVRVVGAMTRAMAVGKLQPNRRMKVTWAQTQPLERAMDNTGR